MLLVCVLRPARPRRRHRRGADGDAEGQFYTAAMTQIVGHGAASFFTICIIASLLLSMTSSTADAGRALFGISRAGMTIKQLGVLNRFHVPARAMTVDLVVNICLVVFITSNLAILYMSNIGYVLCHVFALSGFLLLRRDRPNWPRPIKVERDLAADRGGAVRAERGVPARRGARAASSTATARWTDFGIGVGVLVGSLLLFFFRRVVRTRSRCTGASRRRPSPTPRSSPCSARPRCQQGSRPRSACLRLRGPTVALGPLEQRLEREHARRRCLRAGRRSARTAPARSRS